MIDRPVVASHDRWTVNRSIIAVDETSPVLVSTKSRKTTRSIIYGKNVHNDFINLYFRAMINDQGTALYHNLPVSGVLGIHCFSACHNCFP